MSRILVVDADAGSARTVAMLLRKIGYEHVKSTADVGRLVRFTGKFDPELVMVDLHLSPAANLAVTGYLDSMSARLNGPIVLGLTSENGPQIMARATSLGIGDLLRKPCEPVEALLRTRSLLELRALRARTEGEHRSVEERVRERTAELEEIQSEILERLALAAEYRDDTTGRHTERVGQLSALVAYRLGLPAPQVGLLRRAAPLHDIGKISLPDEILLKPGKLTRRQYERMKAHTTIGARMLSQSRYPVLQKAAEVALTHHERWDGSGYPRGLRKEAIPLLGRIVAVADVWDALTHARPYKPAWTAEQAMAEIGLQSGRHFDPQVVTAFFHVYNSAAPDDPGA